MDDRSRDRSGGTTPSRSDIGSFARHTLPADRLTNVRIPRLVRGNARNVTTDVIINTVLGPTEGAPIGSRRPPQIVTISNPYRMNYWSKTDYMHSNVSKEHRLKRNGEGFVQDHLYKSTSIYCDVTTNVYTTDCCMSRCQMILTE